MTTLPQTTNTNPFVALLKRPEALSLVSALIVTGLAAFAKAQGLPVSEEAITKVSIAFWTVFVGAVFEGKLKGKDYVTDFKTFLGSLKWQAAAVGLGVVVIGALFSYLGVALPDAVVQEVSNAMYVAMYSVIVGKTAVDAVGVVSAR